MPAGFKDCLTVVQVPLLSEIQILDPRIVRNEDQKESNEEKEGWDLWELWPSMPLGS